MLWVLRVLLWRFHSQDVADFKLGLKETFYSSGRAAWAPSVVSLVCFFTGRARQGVTESCKQAGDSGPRSASCHHNGSLFHTFWLDDPRLLRELTCVGPVDVLGELALVPVGVSFSCGRQREREQRSAGVLLACCAASMLWLNVKAQTRLLCLFVG